MLRDRPDPRRKMLKYLVTLFALFAIGYAQTRCISPNQLTANVSVSEYSETRKELFFGFINLYYDAVNQRVRTDDFFIDIPNPNERARFTVIADFKQKIEYRVNLETGTCERVELTLPFQPIEIPQTAYFRGQAYVGVEGALGASLRADIWVGFTESGGRYGGLWTENCLPVLDFYRSETDWRHWDLFDVENTVDPSKFNKPTQCP